MVPQQYFIHDLAGSSEALKKVIESLRFIAPSKLNVLIQGESGTGKEVTVKAIYCNSGLAGHLVPVNCATVGFGGKAPQEVLGKGGNVLHPIAQRRRLNGEKI